MDDKKNGEVTIEKISHKNIFSALSALQGELKPIPKTGKVKFKAKTSDAIIDFSYAPIETILEFIYPILAKNGLSIRHEIKEKSVECILNHETSEEIEIKVEEYLSPQNTVGGHTEEGMLKKVTYKVTTTNELRSGKLVVDLTKSDMKEVGGQITYGRRYTLGLVLGLATEEDKDTELMDASRKNTEKFAFTQAKNALEKATGKDLEKQMKFLEGELQFATDLEAGKGKVVPSLGLKASQYQSLLVIGKAKLLKVDNKDN